MNRRAFVKTSLGATALVAPPAGSHSRQEPGGRGTREYYELRLYHVQSGRQQKVTDAYLREALVPALNRMGISPVGVFSVAVGPGSPTFYALMPAASLEMLATVEARLGQDSDYWKAGGPFLTAPADQAPF